jgi:hypothetical protein
MLKTIGGVLLLWLLSATLADAAPIAGRRSSPVCDSHTSTLRKLRRQATSFGGPLKRMMKRRATAVVIDTTGRITRAARAPIDEDDAAIQNDAPVSPVHADDRPVPALQPLGVLPRSLDLRLSSHTFSPRSPRGPPLYA